MVDEEKRTGKTETPPLEKRAPEEATTRRPPVESEIGLKKDPLPQQVMPAREDEEIFQAIHDTINHILQMISGVPAPQYAYNMERPLGYSVSMNYPQAVPAPVYAPFGSGVQYPPTPQTVSWPGTAVQTPYLIQ